MPTTESMLKCKRVMTFRKRIGVISATVIILLYIFENGNSTYLVRYTKSETKFEYC
jgi:uncharacterized membrane protein